MQVQAAGTIEPSSELRLEHGSEIAVLGGGPAGSFFSYFLLDMAERADLDLRLDLYEPRDFSRAGPPGCNMCGGVISETLVQNLATEGVVLPPSVVQRGTDSYLLHMDVGSVMIETPLSEMRIAAVYRGAGPRGLKKAKWDSFDGHLQGLARRKGANVIPERVEDIRWADGRPEIKCRSEPSRVYDLLAVASGVNSMAFKPFPTLEIDYRPPSTTRAFIREYRLGEERVGKYLGSSMHVFLLNIPRLEFGAIIPKGDYATVCLLGRGIDRSLVQSFLDAPEVRQCLPPGTDLDEHACQCWPQINVRGAGQPFADRVVFIGDCGVTRLYKDGIGAAYRTAKAAATTAVFHGISSAAFRRHYWPVCRQIERDNTIGRVIFALAREVQKRRYARSAVLEMTRGEQQKEGGRRRMSMVLWDVFTGSSPYQDILLRTLHPAFWSRFLWENAVSVLKSLKASVRASGRPVMPRPAAPGSIDEGESRTA